MIRMLGRLMWVAVGAIGLKAWEASEQQRVGGSSRGGNSGGSSGNRSSGTRSRRSTSGGSSD